MKVADILRNLANEIESLSAQKAAELMTIQAQQANNQANALAQQGAQDAMQGAEETQEPVVVSVTNFDNTDTKTMVTPLQQEYELMKKEYGAYQEPQNECDGEGPEDDLSAMLKLAGIGEPEQDLNVADNLRPVSINPRMVAALHFNGKA